MNRYWKPVFGHMLEQPDDQRPTSPSFPESGRIASIDYGTVRIGIAVCDPEWILASPLEVFATAELEESGEEFFRDLAAGERIEGFVVGLPIHCDGGESQTSVTCRQFARWLQNVTGRPVRMFDERFTTADAKQRMAAGGYTRKKEKKRIDAVAALVLLESFLEACRYRREVAGKPVESKPVGGESLE